MAEQSSPCGTEVKDSATPSTNMQSENEIRRRIIANEFLAFFEKQAEEHEWQTNQVPVEIVEPDKQLVENVQEIFAEHFTKKPISQQSSSKMDQKRKPPSVDQVKHVKTKRHIEDLCKINDLIGQRFRVVEKFKEGGFGQIYKAYDLKRKNAKVAVKVERVVDGIVDHVEERVLQKLQNMPHCPVLFASGSTPVYQFVALQLLGKNLSDIRKSCRLSPERMSTSSCVRVTIQCMNALESLHFMGYLHRDVKPSNFAVGKESKNCHLVYILDFGLARYYLTRDGHVRKPRESCGFRGTVRYASITAHALLDLSRRDDLYSLFYSFCEMFVGQLPWRKTNDKVAVAELKLRYSPEVLCSTLPKEIAAFVQHIQTLRYEDDPDYEAMRKCLEEFLFSINAKFTDVYDWQVHDCRKLYHWIPKTPNVAKI